MIYSMFESPLGPCVIAEDNNKITGVYFIGPSFESVPADWIEENKNELLLNAKRQLQDYFAGNRQTFDLPLNLHGTEFQQAVWHALQHIPFGKTTTYGAIAQKIGRPKAVRAVGAAIGKNPICVIVPCHRVIGSNGTLTGYAGGIDRKKSLLRFEGVTNFR